MVVWKLHIILFVILCSCISFRAYSQETTESEESEFEGPIFKTLTVEDAEAFAAAIQHRINVPPIMSKEGVNIAFGLTYRSLPTATNSDFVNAFAESTSVLVNGSLGIEWATERQKTFFHGFYLPFFSLTQYPIGVGFYYGVFGQDLLLAQSGKEGRGLIFSYRFGYSKFDMTRQKTVEDTTNLAFWTSNSQTSEVTLGFRGSDTDITFWLLGGSVTDNALEQDFKADSKISVTLASQYYGAGFNLCFREEVICSSIEFHTDPNSGGTYTGNFIVRK